MASNAPKRLVSRSSYRLSYRANNANRRSFSSSATALTIGPESPNYIDVPKPAQSDFTPKPKLRGFLPVPRPLFNDIRDSKGRVIREALVRRATESTLEPSSSRAKALPKHADRAAYKSRQAESRRRNLREGVSELLERKERMDSTLAAKSRRKQAERAELVSRPEREDERLTRGSVLSAMLQSGPLQDPHREERLAQKRQNFAAVQQLRVEERQDALHTLYMNARTFITNERQLDEQIEKEFGTKEKPRVFGHGTNGRSGTSYWDEGSPPTTADMLRNVTENENSMRLYADLGKKVNIAQERIRRMAEELTGGKM
ncbi:MAG: hypothetical protein M1822_000691 [Bathelium mastoideum]|nr:MAG: hypothetical protein M1822_000691 [Bathelium mastoideum]